MYNINKGYVLCSHANIYKDIRCSDRKIIIIMSTENKKKIKFLKEGLFIYFKKEELQW